MTNDNENVDWWLKDGPLTPDDAVALWRYMQEWESKLAELEELAFQRILHLRERGATWAWLGAALGITRQAAQQRFKRYQAYEDAREAFIVEAVRAHERGEEPTDVVSTADMNEAQQEYWDWYSEQIEGVRARVSALMAEREQK